MHMIPGKINIILTCIRTGHIRHRAIAILTRSLITLATIIITIAVDIISCNVFGYIFGR